MIIYIINKIYRMFKNKYYILNKKMYNFKNILFFSFFFNIIICDHSSEKKIKLCNFTTHCPQVGKEFSVDIFFNRVPATITEGELIKYSDSNIRVKSSPTILSDKKSVSFKFVPELMGKYYLQFNKNLRCDDEIIVKQNIGLEKMTGIVFISEKTMGEKFEIDLNFKFNISFSYGTDINDIELEQISEGNQRFENRLKATNCLMKNENKDLLCHFIFENGLEYKEETKHLSVSYYNRCNEPITLGFMDVMKANKKENNLSTTFLENLKLFLMSKYKKDKKMLITFLYDPEIKAQRIFIEENVSELANHYQNYIVTIMNWKDGEFIANHFGVKDNGYIHITIVDFSNDNEYGGEIRSKEEMNEILEQLEKYTLKWTSQSLTQKIFTFFRVKINADEESKFNWYFGIIGSVIIIGMRCFFFARKMAREQANLQVNPNPKKEN